MKDSTDRESGCIMPFVATRHFVFSHPFYKMVEKLFKNIKYYILQLHLYKDRSKLHYIYFFSSDFKRNENILGGPRSVVALDISLLSLQGGWPWRQVSACCSHMKSWP